MFRQFARLPLRRCLHSQAGSGARPFSRQSRTVYALGASATVVGYLAWSWGANGQRISLDSETASPAPKRQATSPRHTPFPEAADVPTPSAPPNDVRESFTISPEGKEPPTTPSDAPVDNEGAQTESSGGAFNPETGEINWDCPCLGGMAYGPCGQEFREAFSCFVYSEADPKGIDCVEKFKAMQDCFRAHPEVYADEIMNDDEEEPSTESSTTEKVQDSTLLPDNLPAQTEQTQTFASS